MGVALHKCRHFGVLLVAGALACNGTTPPPAAPRATPVVEADERLDTSALAGAAKARFEAERVEIVDSDTNACSYAFMRNDLEISQAVFEERYREVTGDTDLDQITRASPGTPLIVLGGMAIGGSVAGELALVSSSHQSTCNQVPTSTGTQQICVNQNSGPSTDVAVGTTLLAAVTIAGAALVVAGVHSNRRSHELSRHDAERLAMRYNRVLLQRAVPSGGAVPQPAGTAQ